MSDEPRDSASRETETLSRWRRVMSFGRRALRRTTKWAGVLTLIYAAIVLVGLIPVNNDFRPADDGVTVYVVSNAVHTDIVVPRRAPLANWDEELGPLTIVGDVSEDTYVAFGWGDRGFYLETPTWKDLKLSTAINALFLPSRTCVHVTYVRPEYLGDARQVTISREQYGRLVKYLRESLERDSEGRVRQIPGYAYATNDAFLEARGAYHLFNTCNTWAGGALRAAGVRTPWYSPLPGTPTLYLR